MFTTSLEFLWYFEHKMGKNKYTAKKHKDM